MVSGTEILFALDPVESRTLLSTRGSAVGGIWHQPWGLLSNNNNPAIQRDLLKIQLDKRRLADDRRALFNRLQDDQKALRDAIKAMDGQLAPLRAKLRTDRASWWTILSNDLKSMRQDRGDPIKLAQDIAQLQSDRASFDAVVKADMKAIQDAIDDDAAVQAAREKLQADSQPVREDLVQLQADYAQLRKHLQAQSGAGSAKSLRFGRL